MLKESLTGDSIVVGWLRQEGDLAKKRSLIDYVQLILHIE